MPPRGNAFVRGQLYHVYNRAAAQDQLFYHHGNYLHCLRLTKKFSLRYGVAVMAYCLMPNHYHFLLRQEHDIHISKFVNVLFNAYVQAVNREQGRKGTMFESRFRYVHVDRDEYARYLCRYIHLNPKAATLVNDPAEWPYSNYLEFIGARAGQLMDYDFMRQYWSTAEGYEQFVDNAPGTRIAGFVPAGGWDSLDL